MKLEAYPRDLNDLEGVEGDVRTLSNLFDGVGCTVDDEHMWLTPFLKAAPEIQDGDPSDANQRNYLRITFSAAREVAGFNIWNYNKNLEDSLALEALKPRSDVHPGPRRNEPAFAFTMSNAFIREVDIKHYRTVFTLQVKIGFACDWCRRANR
ncbi:Katnip [Symbiodinium pilosum]|uniref:Katnip protein n=1 Tax=Symbiodinium pilosum TaxID=2952 RepID=A0A812IXF5_SYMPI|nr:Katnip [Symbiodinium pilosum]